MGSHVILQNGSSRRQMNAGTLILSNRSLMSWNARVENRRIIYG